MEKKICNKCLIDKNYCDFRQYKSRNGKFSIRGSCKECETLLSKEYYKKNKNIINEKTKKNYVFNKEKELKRRKKHYTKNKDKELLRMKNYREKNKEYFIEYRKKYQKNYEFNRLQNDPIYRLSKNLRRRINLFLKSINISKKNTTFEIIGCSPELLKIHLEKQFEKDMCWENYGYYGWHIDHIIPLSSAKNEDDLIKLNHYSNLQPLWSEENLKKGSKILS